MSGRLLSSNLKFTRVQDNNKNKNNDYKDYKYNKTACISVQSLECSEYPNLRKIEKLNFGQYQKSRVKNRVARNYYDQLVTLNPNWNDFVVRDKSHKFFSIIEKNFEARI